MYFTFDDGPHPEFTPAIAAVLEDAGHRGTFFCTAAAARQHPTIVRRLVAAGHGVGSHSSTHRRSRGRSAVPVVWDYLKGHQQVRRVAQTDEVSFRPPYGIDDRRARVSAAVLRTPMFLWSCDSNDWRIGASAASVVATVTPALTPGAIVLFHDRIADEARAADRTHTVAAVTELVDTLHGQGMRSERLPVDLAPAAAGAMGRLAC